MPTVREPVTATEFMAQWHANRAKRCDCILCRENGLGRPVPKTEDDAPSRESEGNDDNGS